MASIARTAIAVAAVLTRAGIDYAQSKAVFKAARQRAGLHSPPERRGSVDRLTVEEELRFLDQAYAQNGRTGLMLQTLLETGARASELVQLRVEDVSLGERVITIRHGKGRQAPGGADPARAGQAASAAYRWPPRRAAIRQPPAGLRSDAVHADPPTRWPNCLWCGSHGWDHQACLPAPAAAYGRNSAARAWNGHC